MSNSMQFAHTTPVPTTKCIPSHLIPCNLDTQQVSLEDALSNVNALHEQSLEGAQLNSTERYWWWSFPFHQMLIYMNIDMTDVDIGINIPNIDIPLCFTRSPRTRYWCSVMLPRLPGKYQCKVWKDWKKDCIEEIQLTISFYRSTNTYRGITYSNCFVLYFEGKAVSSLLKTKQRHYMFGDILLAIYLW